MTLIMLSTKALLASYLVGFAVVLEAEGSRGHFCDVHDSYRNPPHAPVLHTTDSYKIHAIKEYSFSCVNGAFLSKIALWGTAGITNIQVYIWVLYGTPCLRCLLGAGVGNLWVLGCLSYEVTICDSTYPVDRCTLSMSGEMVLPHVRGRLQPACCSTL